MNELTAQITRISPRINTNHRNTQMDPLFTHLFAQHLHRAEKIISGILGKTGSDFLGHQNTLQT